jgi:hypothetical protein
LLLSFPEQVVGPDGWTSYNIFELDPTDPNKQFVLHQQAGAGRVYYLVVNADALQRSCGPFPTGRDALVALSHMAGPEGDKARAVLRTKADAVQVGGRQP